MKSKELIGRKINAVAPIRICDIGGWTDTWFAKHGTILNFAVYPYVETQLFVKKRTSEERIKINLENFGDSYRVNPDKLTFDKHPLIEAAISMIQFPEDIEFEINIYSQIPPGASTGTSAAVSIALIGALDSLSYGKLCIHEVASLAHFVETEKLGLQSGIQDQICSAYGGINYIEMQSFPDSSVSPVKIPDSVWWELESRIVLVYIGSPHQSSEIHKRVIEGLGDGPEEDTRIVKLRDCAKRAKNALYSHDLTQFGEIMTENTEIQRLLNSELICAEFDEIMEIGRLYGCIGFKVNGAGGDGGSITLLTNGDNTKKRTMLRELSDKGYSSLNIYLSRYGLRVW